MIILEKIDYDGDDLVGDLQKLDEIHARIQQKIGGRIEGPYLPQDASLLYIIHIDKFELLNQTGRVWIEEISRAKLPFTPKSYELAVTPKEFFG
jgi:hypothetical protein